MSAADSRCLSPDQRQRAEIAEFVLKEVLELHVQQQPLTVLPQIQLQAAELWQAALHRRLETMT